MLTRLLIGIIANGLLFVSGLIVLIDFAPLDSSRGYRRQVEAVVKLRQNHNVAIPVPHVTIDFGNEGGILDAGTFEVLTKMIREHSSYSNTVPWAQVVSVGYGTMRMPVGSGKSIEGLHSLFVAVRPQDSRGKELENFPVGLLDDLDRWIAVSHQRSLTLCAAWLLTLGFFLQLGLGITDLFISRRTKARADGQAC